MAEGIKGIGGDPDNIQSYIRKNGDFHAFLELHIEQGGILESEKIQIGVVEGIIGRIAWDVSVTLSGEWWQVSSIQKGLITLSGSQPHYYCFVKIWRIPTAIFEEGCSLE